MIFSYRTRQFFRRFFHLLLTVLAAALALALVWLLWLQRFVVYTPEGAVLDFYWNRDNSAAVEAKPLKPLEDIYIQYGPGIGGSSSESGLQKLTGYYVGTDQLQEDLASVQQKLLSLPAGTPVLLDVKGIWGYFFYPTAVGNTTSTSFDMETMEAFFEAVNSAGLYTVARLPAFRDYDFARTHPSCALTRPNGYTYEDEDHCYWLEPDNDTVLSYLIQITRELQRMGFDEVVFKDFCFPDTDKLSFEGDRDQVIAKAAKTLVTACASDSFLISFQTYDPGFPLPEGNCRLYLQDVAAADAESILAASGLENAAKRIVFLAETNDTRYDAAGTLRPLDMAI